MNEELNKELCELLGICWHDDSLEVGGVAVGLCRKCGAFNPVSNPDFISEAGRVQLLKLIEKHDCKFIAKTYGITPDRDNKTVFWLAHHMTDDPGKLAIEARDVLRRRDYERRT